MTNETTAYIPHNPGDLVTAEDWNDVQRQIKEDIQNQIESAKEEIKDTGVKRADNADKFDNKTPKGWTDELDERYALKIHDHEELAAYRRYYKQMEAGDVIVLEHKLDRFPLVDVYVLLPIYPEPTGEGEAEEGEEYIEEKFYLYYHHEERDRDRLYTQERGRQRWPWGTPIEQLLLEYQVEWEDDDSLGDVANDFLEAFFTSPTDHISHRTSPWIDEKRDRTIAELKRRDEWPDIRWAVRPEKLVVGTLGMGERAGREGELLVEVTHLSYNTLEIRTASNLGANVEAIDLMILLRS